MPDCFHVALVVGLDSGLLRPLLFGFGLAPVENDFRPVLRGLGAVTCHALAKGLPFGTVFQGKFGSFGIQVFKLLKLLADIVRNSFNLFWLFRLGLGRLRRNFTCRPGLRSWLRLTGLVKRHFRRGVFFQLFRLLLPFWLILFAVLLLLFIHTQLKTLVQRV